MRYIWRLMIFLYFSHASSTLAQEKKDSIHNLTADIDIQVETQVTAGNSTTPLWLNANKYGLSSLKANNGYIRISAERDVKVDSSRNWGIGYGIDMALAYNNTSSIILQQAYVECRYKSGTITVGQKQQPLELRIQELSSGSQTLGTNSRPIPQVRIGLNDYWNIPWTNRWLAFKGHFAYGVMTDGNWQERFSTNTKYNKLTRYHQKAGYLRIGNEDTFPLTLTFGLEMAAEFGGYLYNWRGTDEEHHASNDRITLKHDLNSYLNAFFGFGSDVGETLYKNSEGNLLGSWVARINWKADKYNVGLYFDHYFEDHSSMFFLDYDGYGTGVEWNQKKYSRFFLYDLKDFMLGADLILKGNKFINQFVLEYMNTKYQSGPIYHDHNTNGNTHISGKDNYYNHSSMPGWQHWGQVIGNPLYLSPLYNNNGRVGILCNRFKAWHFGLSGNPTSYIQYRTKFSWQRGYGTYDEPYLDPKENISILLEASYNMCNTSFTAAWGADFGTLRGNNTAWQFTIKRSL